MLLDITSGFYSWIRGGLSVLFIYHFIFYLLNRDRLNKYYSIYLFCIVVYLTRDVFENQTVVLFYQYISFSIQYIAYFYFIQFCRSLIRSQRGFIKLDVIARKFSWMLIFFALILIVVQFFYGFEIQKKVVAFSVPFASICSLFVFYMLVKSKSKHSVYLLIGSVFFLIAANISSIKMMKGEYYLIDLPVHRMFYYFIGAFTQSIIFTALISGYLKEIFEKKQQAELNLLKQKNQIAQLKMVALKSQMNPHFLFNSLNSINSYVIQNKVDEASNFITKFSILIRKVLQVTNENSISLEEELEILSVYIKLEQMRLKNGFSIETQIDESIEVSKLRVVPLFLQPFIENAIWHGLSFKEGEKKIKLSIYKLGEMVRVLIRDNGIGIKRSKSRRLNKSSDRKSFGISIVKERMEIMYGKTVDIRIKDLKDGKETGTQISIVFPLKLA
ncbi:Histidine kinase-, DNA gyrase B-, and HSP90-like ATPase [Tenacibaculum sp. MAR_2009_124]|uniref:sensor histidine kinase n=1 Tax=Tenacibaculum sp. MAR_2009_124 TaxID=1250059 RepID=UPI00089D4BC3|nr:histidine kinase [Tenacibaculum sp. MAR_2009_124]SEC52645.1 Histidine kinase-, DNA gyrase B-, and HSP90-like ATPase [Tenacibaculum sp. MAR_2009_124]